MDIHLSSHPTNYKTFLKRATAWGSWKKMSSSIPELDLNRFCTPGSL